MDASFNFPDAAVNNQLISFNACHAAHESLLWRFLSSVHHHSRVAPVELLACDGQCSSHALEDITHSLVGSLDLGLILGLGYVDRLDNALSIRILQRDACELFLQTEMNVSVLKVVIVNLDRT